MSMTISPLHLSINHLCATGEDTNLHLIENGDLSVGDHAALVVRSSDDGALVIGLGIDSDHDEIHVARTSGTHSPEILRRGIEALTVALDAVERVAGSQEVTR